MADIARVPLNIERRADRGRVRHSSKLALEDRRRLAQQYRLGGYDCTTIALMLAADPEINSQGNAVPGGYGWRNYVDGLAPPSIPMLARSVKADLAVLHNRHIDDSREASEEMFWLEMDRLDKLTSFVWRKAGDGSERHVGRAVEISERRSKMMGWDKSPVTVTVEGSIGVHAESPQPVVTPEWLHSFYLAMEESSLEPPETLEALAAVLPELEESTVETIPADAIETSSVEA